jgi:hypothetical protein
MPQRRMGGVEVKLQFFLLWHWMEVNFHLHSPAALPSRKECPDPLKTRTLMTIIWPLILLRFKNWAQRVLHFFIFLNGAKVVPSSWTLMIFIFVLNDYRKIKDA